MAANVGPPARDMWIVDFGVNHRLEASCEAPSEHVRRAEQAHSQRHAVVVTWRSPRAHRAPSALARFAHTVRRQTPTLRVAARRQSIPDTATVAIARADDTTFGIPHSRMHRAVVAAHGHLAGGATTRATPTTC